MSPAWFFSVGVVLHSSLYLQVFVGAIHNADVYCPGFNYGDSISTPPTIVSPCKGNEDCKVKGQRCCTRIVINSEGAEDGGMSTCVYPEIKSPRGYCPVVNISDDVICPTSCEHDNECPDKKICCLDGCKEGSKMCAIPQADPPKKKIRRCSPKGMTTKSCVSDYDCIGEQTCCPDSNGQGYCFRMLMSPKNH